MATLTDALLRQWSSTGSTSVRTALTKAVGKSKGALNATQVSDTKELYGLLYELVWAVAKDKLAKRDMLALFKDLDMKGNAAASEVFADLLWTIGNEIELRHGKSYQSTVEWQHLSRLVKSLADEHIVPLMQLKMTLEFDLLHEAGLTEDSQKIRKKLIRINTKTFYTQVKYNLLREESEGFAKVLGLLHRGISNDVLESSKADLLSLIGYFNLDANRVLDLVLDAYESDPRNDCFLDLLSTFKQASIPHVLGFKFQFYARHEEEDAKETPASLCRLAAAMVQHQVITLDSLLPHLSPSKASVISKAKEEQEKLEKKAKSFGKVNLGAKPSDEKEEVEEDKEPWNQIYGLMRGLLEIGATDVAFRMMDEFRKEGVDPLGHPQLSHQLCHLVHSQVYELCQDLVYRDTPLLPTKQKGTFISLEPSFTPSPFVTPLKTYEEVVEQVYPTLEMLSSELHRDQLLLTQLLRLTKAILASGNDQVADKTKRVVSRCFLPSLSRQACNPSTAFFLWDVVKPLTFEDRYRLYQQWEASYALSPSMQLVEAQTVQSTRKVMRRLTADRAKQSARSLTHAGHSNPLVVFRTMLRQIQSYDNLIQPVVESFKFMTSLAMDVLSFCLVSELSKSQQSMKADGTNVSLWLTSLANFAGSFYRKYPTVELSGLLQYLLQRLRNWQSVDLVVLSELLSKMGSCVSFEDISWNQLEAQAGGPHLWHEPSDPKVLNRRAVPRLRDALVKRQMALPLCLLMCQMRSKIEFDDDPSTKHLKLVGRLYDTCQMTLSQLLDFLYGVVDPDVYMRMLPSVSSLMHEYHISPELVMTLCRPAIRFDDPLLKTTPRSVHAIGGGSRADDADRKAWSMTSKELEEDVSSALQGQVEGLTTRLYLTFWSLILYDLHVPFQQYDVEIQRLRASSHGSASDVKKSKEKASQRMEKLTNEQKDQVAHRKRVIERLEAEKALLFRPEDYVKSETSVHDLLQRCVIPRALLSPEDALFCAKFVDKLHAVSTPAFSTLQYYHKLMEKLPTCVLCVTEREAGNFGVFLKETMGVLLGWYESLGVYQTEALEGKVGFSLDLVNPDSKMTHGQYKRMYAKWHQTMTTVYMTTLGGKAYMPVRNSLVVLTKLIDVFPSCRVTAAYLLEIVEELTKEEREDLKIMAKRYFALLTKRKASLSEDRLLSQNLTPKEDAKEEKEMEAGEVDKEEESERRRRRSSERQDDRRRRENRTSRTDDEGKSTWQEQDERKRQRFDQTEAALRRQLTEQKEQEKKPEGQEKKKVVSLNRKRGREQTQEEESAPGILSGADHPDGKRRRENRPDSGEKRPDDKKRGRNRGRNDTNQGSNQNSRDQGGRVRPNRNNGQEHYGSDRGGRRDNTSRRNQRR